MSKFISVLLVLALGLVGCTSQGRVSGDPTAVMLGANIGGMAGSIIGAASSRCYHGELMGAIAGTVAGALVANAATTPVKRTEERTDCCESYPAASVDYVNKDLASKLVVRNLRFIDDNKNHIIESGEHAKIIFEVVNSGRTAAFHITPVVMEKSGLKRLYISSSVTLECIPAGDGVRYTASISAGRMPEKGEAVFHVTVLDEEGDSLPVREFVIPVRK